jgi:hypothetical protein
VTPHMLVDTQHPDTVKTESGRQSGHAGWTSANAAVFAVFHDAQARRRHGPRPGLPASRRLRRQSLARGSATALGLVDTRARSRFSDNDGPSRPSSPGATRAVRAPDAGSRCHTAILRSHSGDTTDPVRPPDRQGSPDHAQPLPGHLHTKAVNTSERRQMRQVKVTSETSRSSRWAVREVPSAEDLDPHQRTDAPTTSTPLPACFVLSRGNFVLF